MSALRLARGFTKRSRILKFAGCYHGHADFLLVKAGSGAATFGVPDSEGVPEGAARDTLTVNFNDLPAVEAIFAILAIRDQIAPPTLNLDNPSIDTFIDLVPHKAKKRDIDVVLSNSFGFGGTNASLVFRRFVD